MDTKLLCSEKYYDVSICIYSTYDSWHSAWIRRPDEADIGFIKSQSNLNVLIFIVTLLFRERLYKELKLYINMKHTF